MFALESARNVVTSAPPQVANRIASKVSKAKTSTSGQKYHQPISFSFADVIDKVIAVVFLKCFTVPM